MIGKLEGHIIIKGNEIKMNMEKPFYEGKFYTFKKDPYFIIESGL